MQSHYANLKDIRLHYVSQGSGPLILFLHGFPQFWYEWKDHLTEFSRDHHAVAPDLRGYNLSSKPESLDDYAIPKVVDDIRQLITHLGHSRCVLVGHDWGGVIAWAFAFRHSELLDHLVIINAPHPGVFQRLLQEDPGQRQASQYFEIFCQDETADGMLADDMARLCGTFREGLEEGYFTEDDLDQYREAWSQDGAIQGGLNYYRKGPVTGVDDADDFDEVFPSLDVDTPTLVVWGEGDRFLLPSNLDGLDAYVPDLEIVRIPGASHWVPNQCLDQICGEIRRFIDRS